MATAALPKIQTSEPTFQQRVVTQLSDTQDAYFATDDPISQKIYWDIIQHLVGIVAQHNILFKLVDNEFQVL